MSNQNQKDAIIVIITLFTLYYELVQRLTINLTLAFSCISFKMQRIGVFMVQGRNVILVLLYSINYLKKE